MFDYSIDYSIPIFSSPKYVSAKIILIGESGAGKTGLGWRLAHKEYKEHSSTHGQQFWLVKDLETTRTDGSFREAVLWDFAGQPDYRLIHSLFLDNTKVAMLLFDPTISPDPLRGLEYWLKTLRCGNTADCKVVLVAGRCDRGTGVLTESELRDYCNKQGIDGGFFYTSAKENENVAELLERVKSLIPWDEFPTTSTTATFKQIKDLTLRRKETVRSENLLVTPEALQTELRADDPTLVFNNDEFSTVIDRLQDHGFLYKLTTTGGEERLLLTPERLNNLAASFILQARNHPDGLGALEEEKIYSNHYNFSELRDLPEETKKILQDTVVRLFIDRQVAFRETQGSMRVLVFPELINIKRPELEEVETEEGVSYSVRGPIENLYASLVVRLGYSNLFEKKHCWYNNAQYTAPDGTLCGFRQIADREGEREFILFFTKDSVSLQRRIFESFFESLLDPHRLQIERFPIVHCTACGERQTRQNIINRIRQGKDFVFCSECGERITLTLAPSLTLTAKEKRHMEEARRTAQAHTRYESARAGLEQAFGPTPENITVFISYAWGVTEHEDWVERKLADHLQDAGFDVLLDRWENSAAGKGVARFIERIPKSDFVVIVGTPKYVEKYEKKLSSTGTVVSTEIELINTCFIYNSEEGASKLIPLILSGNRETALPPLLRGRVYYDFQNPETYHTTLFDLLLTLRGLSFGDKAVRALRDTLAERKPL